jgi:hypothetical protein
MGAGGVAGREGSQVREICLEGSVRYLAHEMLDFINPRSPDKGKGVDLENNLVLWEGQHSVTGRTLLGKLVRLVGIQFHQ